jgi:predicted enzyme related to lactoylglutathione lyase
MLADSKPIILIPTTNKEVAKDFYKEVLGLSFKSDDGFALVFSAAGIMLRITSVRQFTPHEFAVLGWEAPDIIATIQGLIEKGVKFEIYDFAWMTQDENGAWTAPDGTKVAWFKDPDGNLLSITQHAI